MLLGLKKVWSFIKNYWYIPVIVIGIIVGTIVFREVPQSLLDMLNKRKELHKKELEVIEQVKKEEREKREKALAVYHKTLEQIEEKYEKSKKDLSLRKKNKIKKIIEDTHDDPDELAKQLADQTGFQIVYPKE